MPCILVRNSMNMEEFSCSVAKHAFSGTETYIDSSCGKGTSVAKAIESALYPLSTVDTSDKLTSTWFTNRPPLVVLDKLQDLGLSVVAANTVGVTTVWTLQGNLNVHSMGRPIRNDHRFRYDRTIPDKEQEYF